MHIDMCHSRIFYDLHATIINYVEAIISCILKLVLYNFSMFYIILFIV